VEDLERYRPRLRQVARRIVDDAEAEDVVQETLLRALVSPPPDLGAPMLPWLSVVARRLAIDVVRKQGRLEGSEFEHEADPGEPPSRCGLGELLPGLGTLSDNEVVVLLLRESLELDVEAVARALDTSPGTVRVAHHRARKKAAGGSDPAAGLDALDRFCTWLLARHVAGIPVATAVAGAEPALTEGVLRSHRRLLDAVVDAARLSGRQDLLRRALTSRGVAASVLREPGAAENLQAALDAGGTIGQLGAPLVRALVDAGRAQEASAWLERALDACHLPRHQRLLHSLGLQLALDGGDAVGAGRHHDALAGLVADTPGAQAMGWVGDGYRATAEERWEDARAAWWAAWGLAREFGNPVNELTLLNNLVLACLSGGRLDEADEHLGRARDLVAKSRLSAERALELDGNAATLLVLRGERQAATVAFERLVPAFTASGQAVHAALARFHLGVLAHLAGDVAGAERVLDLAVRHLVGGGADGLSLGVELHREAARVSLGRSEPQALEHLRVRALAARRPSTARAAAIHRSAALGHPIDPDPEDPTPIVQFARWLCLSPGHR
jgi:RNA polymerase sigma factor (sigma-70 family)